MKWEPIAELAASVQSGAVTARALVERSLQAIESSQDFNAILRTNPQALAAADEIDRRVKDGEEVGPLAGVPFVAKDNFLTKDLETTAASNILKGYLPPYSATAITKLEAAGAVLVAKANLDAFAHGASTENSDFGPTLNPHDKSRVAGGSSGGSAAAVALGLAPFALGTDTGGSIRQPASFCGVVGLKPTYGLVSRYGVVAMASSTDVIGPLTSNVADAALVLDVMSGRDERDSTTIEREDDGYAQPVSDLKGKAFGIIKEYMGDGLDATVRQAIEEAARKLEAAGATIKEVSVPSIKMALPVYYIVMPAEVSSNLARYDGVRYGYSAPEATTLDETYDLTRSQGLNAENKRRIMMGTFVLSSGYYDAYYKKAQAVRTILINEFEVALQGVDGLIGPTAPTTAFRLGENTDDPLKMYLADVMTVAINLVGVPAINLPVTKADGLPVGLQIITPQRTDRQLLELAQAAEAAVGYEA